MERKYVKFLNVKAEFVHRLFKDTAELQTIVLTDFINYIWKNVKIN